jgi:hypothetical protein
MGKLKVEGSGDQATIATTERSSTQLRLRAFEPRRKKRKTALDEVRNFLVLAFAVLALLIASLTLTTDPIRVMLDFLAPVLTVG